MWPLVLCRSSRDGLEQRTVTLLEAVIVKVWQKE